MAVTRLTLSNFRCYAFERLSVTGQPVVLCGANGSGKTNVLEALSLLVPGRGLRQSGMGDIARRDKGAADQDSRRPWGVAATVQTAQGPVEIGTGRSAAPIEATGRERRSVHIDGQAAKSQAVLSDHMAAVWLLPQMDRLFLDGPSARRKFLDRLVFGFDASHSTRMNGFEHALRERAKLLKEGRADATWLAALETRMAENAVAVAAARLDVCERLDALARKGRDPFPGAELAVDGFIEAQLRDGTSALDVEDTYRTFLSEARPKDALTGGASDGVHKSDLRVRHVPKDRPAEDCSTGEQKALLTGIILANTRLLALETGRIPLLLLDEVGAHLDEDRREALFDEIHSMGAQAWLTGTDETLFAPLKNRATFLHVQDGRIVA